MGGRRDASLGAIHSRRRRVGTGHVIVLACGWPTLLVIGVQVRSVGGFVARDFGVRVVQGEVGASGHCKKKWVSVCACAAE